jgi:hypothetical protein
MVHPLVLVLQLRERGRVEALVRCDTRHSPRGRAADAMLVRVKLQKR